MDVLSEEQCWELLNRDQIGRLGVVVAGRPDIFPVNYLLHEGEIYFKTAEGSKLASIMTHREVAFEVDGYDEETNEAWSVVVNGMARVLTHEEDEEQARGLPITPWHIEPKRHFVVIEPSELSGRRFVAEGRR